MIWKRSAGDDQGYFPGGQDRPDDPPGSLTDLCAHLRPLGRDPRRARRRCPAQAEAAGAEIVWVPELHRSRDRHGCGRRGRHHAPSGVGTAIALAFTRSPMVTALEAMDLDELSGGRFVLGPRQRASSGSTRTGTTRSGASRSPTCARPSRRSARSSEDCTTGEPIDGRGRVRAHADQGLPAHLPPRARRDPDLPRRRRPGHDPRSPARPPRAGSATSCARRAFVTEHDAPEHRRGSGQGRPRPQGHRPRRVRVRRGRRRTARRPAASPPASSASTPRVRTYADFFEFHGFADEQQADRRHVPRRRRSPRRSSATSCPTRWSTRSRSRGTPDQVAASIAAYDGIVDTIKLSPPTSGLAPGRDPRRAAAAARASSPTSPEGVALREGVATI